MRQMVAISVILHSSLPPERPIDLAHDIGRGEADIAQHSTVEPSEQRAVASALPPQTDQTRDGGNLPGNSSQSVRDAVEFC
jgi:hypothetical protein